MSFGETITNLRKRKGITQEQLAEQLGITRQTISKWELDQSTPDLNYIIQLADLYEVTTDYLIKGEASCETENLQELEHFEEEQVGYEEVYEKSNIKFLTSRMLAGIIVSILGGAFLLLGFAMLSSDGMWIFGIMFGLAMFIIGVELIV